MATRPRPKTLGKTGRGEPYLWWRAGRVDSDGVERGGVWWIVHKSKQVRSTGRGAGKSEERLALQALDDYRASLDAPPTKKSRPAEDVLIADVLSRYLDAKAGKVSRFNELAQRVATLLGWWGEKTLQDIDSVSCKDYVASRVGQPWKAHARLGLDRNGEKREDEHGNPLPPARRGHSRPVQARTVSEGGARRELEDLRSAVNLAIADGLTRETIKVTLPPKPEPRERWLTRPEAARLLTGAWRKREVQTIHSGERKGQTYVTPRHPARHLARFILVGLRTGTRSGAICAASFIPEVGRPWLELKEEIAFEEQVEVRVIDGERFERRTKVPVPKRVAIYHRKALGKKAKKNKRYPAVRLPDTLVSHLWRWHHVLGQRYVVEWQGEPVISTGRSFANLVHDLGLADVVRHTLRHTAATWGMQAGTDIWELAGYLGMSVETLERNYGHHSPAHMEQARAAMGARGKNRKVA